MIQYKIQIIFGPVAQLGERSVRIREVDGSIPFRSTKKRQVPKDMRRFYFLTKLVQISEQIEERKSGFVLTDNCNGQACRIERTLKFIFALHTKYAFSKLYRQDLIDISTNNDSFYCIPTKKYVVTKLGLATRQRTKSQQASNFTHKKTRRFSPCFLFDKFKLKR